MHFLKSPDRIQEKAREIRLLVMDVDGVLTNGEIIYTEDGRELKIFNVKDGHGIAMLAHSGMQIALITGRNSPITQRRADELGIRYVFQGIKKKLPVLDSLMTELGLYFNEIAYIGDDTPDIPVLERAGLAICPADAVDEVKEVVHLITENPGGRGAVREVTDLLMKAKTSLQADDTVVKDIV